MHMHIYWSPQIFNYVYSMWRDRSVASQNTNGGIGGDNWSCKELMVYISRILHRTVMLYKESFSSLQT